MDIYDKLLGGIGVTIILMLAGFLVGPALGVGAGVIAMGLIGAAMFVFAPVEKPTTPVAVNAEE